MEESPQLKRTTELVVYLCQSVESGYEHCLFDEVAIQGAGGIFGIEAELERQTYWFVRLGTIDVQQAPSGWFYDEEALANLPQPGQGAWRVGRCNPAFGRGALELQIFEVLFLALSTFVGRWKHKAEDGLIDAYAVKQIKICPNRISSIASALTSIRRAYDVVEMVVMKYWYDPEWPPTSPTVDLILAEFSVSIPVQLRWGTGDKAVAADILPISCC